MSRLEGKAAVVTGAGSGIGLAIARRFAAEGARVACLDRDGDAAEAAARELGGLALAADVGVEGEVEAAFERAAAELGGLDVLVANAGIGGPGRADEIDREHWDRVLAVNLTGVWLCARAAIPRLRERGGGSIVLQGSIAALTGVRGVAAYAAAKGGVIALGRQMAIDYAADRIRVNVLCPGAVWTELTAATYERRGEGRGEQARAAAAARYPLGRLGEPEDIAAAAVYLAGDGSAWVTGVVLPVDGGLSAAS